MVPLAQYVDGQSTEGDTAPGRPLNVISKDAHSEYACGDRSSRYDECVRAHPVRSLRRLFVDLSLLFKFVICAFDFHPVSPLMLASRVRAAGSPRTDRMYSEAGITGAWNRPQL